MNTKAASERYQRQVQELSKLPGNANCADCGGRYPRWASWSLGIFLCVNCAGVHRKMGTHISKVKSLTLDTWNKEQVEGMRAMGNAKSNAKFNPDERRNRPPANVEEGERNSDLERHIFDKYKGRFMDVRPPPVPMKDVPRISPNPTGGNESQQRRRMTDAALTTPAATATRSASRSVTSPVPVSWSDAQRAVTPSSSAVAMPSRSTNPSTSTSLAPPQANVPPRASSVTLQLSRGSSSAGVGADGVEQQQHVAAPMATPSVFDDLLALQNGPPAQPSLSPPLQMLQPNQQMNPWAHLATQQQAIVSPMAMSNASPYFSQQQQQSVSSNGFHAQGTSLGAVAFGQQQLHAFQPSSFTNVYAQQTGAPGFAPHMIGQQAFGGQSPLYGGQQSAAASYFGQPSPSFQQPVQQQAPPAANNNNPFGSFATSMMPTGQQQQQQQQQFGTGGMWQ